MNTSTITRNRTRINRWHWSYSPDTSRNMSVGGWTATKWGARREIAKAEAENFAPNGGSTLKEATATGIESLLGQGGKPRKPKGDK